MNLRAFWTVFILPTMSLLFFQNCTQSNFQGIDEIQKLNTLEQHSGLGDDSLDNPNPVNQGDGGLGQNGGNNTGDDGLGQNPPNNQSDGGGGMLGPGGMIMYPQVNNDDGLSNNGSNNNNDEGSSGMGTGGGSGRDPAMTGPNVFDNGDGGITDAPAGRFQVVRWCRKNDKGKTLKEAKEISIRITDGSTGRVVCEVQNSTMLNQILNNNFVDIPGCDFSSCHNNDMIVEVKSEDGEYLSHGTYDGNSHKHTNAYNHGEVEDEKDDIDFSTVALHLLLDKDFDDYSDMPSECDAHQGSPLVVDMRSERELASIFELTAPKDGIEFDILGHNSYPSIHSPKKISWVKDPRVMPIVLPWNGDVPGVDQMFGDNTLGPDNNFSDNGFEALAKYDGYSFDEGRQVNPDGVINKGDAVYKLLRLWYDQNLDGKVDSRELLTLRQAQVEIIDLRFDPNYYSRDGHGNEIKYKSVIKLKNDLYKPVFDIWFVINKDAQ